MHIYLTSDANVDNEDEDDMTLDIGEGKRAKLPGVESQSGVPTLRCEINWLDDI